MSNKTFNNPLVPVTPEEIINAHNIYGDELITIDLQNKKEYKTKGTTIYSNVLFKLPNKEKPCRIMLKFKNATLVASNIKNPKDRTFEQLKIIFKRYDDLNPNSKLGEALEIICKTYEKVIDKMVDNKIISSRKSDTKSIIFPSTNVKFPMQDTAEDKKAANGTRVTIENPLFYININTKRYDKDELTNLPIMEGVEYSDGNDAYIKSFDFNIYDISKKINTLNHQGKLEKRFEKATDNSGKLINNSNIQEFLRTRSNIS
jgi:hypothetical protein